MATLSIQQQELEELKELTASTFDTSQAQIIKPVFSNENTRLQRLEQLETGTYVPPIKNKGTVSPISSDDNQILIGTPNADTLNGANGDDVITSLGIDDIVSGRNGDDLISGGSGNDYLHGDAGKDIIYGDYSASGNSDLIASGNDTIFGGDKNDKLYGQDGKDLIYGDSGDDYIEGGADNDQINGDDGNDILYGDDVEGNPGVSGDDTISGNNGNDKVFGGRGNDFLKGDAGKDLIFGGQGYDSLDGGNGNDVLIGTDTRFSGQLQQGFGFGERDVLIGGKNNDTFVLGLEKANARDVNGNDTVIADVVLYNDGNISLSGTQDYALIKDFGFINDRVIRGVDKIQLAGSVSQYLLGASPDSSISGTGIFFTQGQFVDELIGIVEGISLSNLSLSNSDQFIFV
ncbi:calcium-binding protein [Nostoc sp.]|uniref:calcium-binding protein n=1 Tax=Nostoc sp. TaxID=1180 RepID=UPI002FF93856